MEDQEAHMIQMCCKLGTPAINRKEISLLRAEEPCHLEQNGFHQRQLSTDVYGAGTEKRGRRTPEKG